MLSSPIAFKTENVQDEYFKTPLFLRLIVEDFAQESFNKFKITAIITRVLEDVPGATGVHPDNRAVDIRDEFGTKFLYSEEQAQHLIDYIENKYKRIDGKPVIIHHSFKNGPVHFHIQIAQFVKTHMGVQSA